MALDKDARDALRAAADADGAHREANPAQRQPGASVDLGMALDPLNPGAEWATLLKPWGRFVAVFLPEVADAYTGPAWDRACGDFGAAFHAVAEKRGWRIDNVAPEVALAMCTLNLAAPAALAVYGRRAAAQARQRDKERQARDAAPPPPPAPAAPPPA